MENDNITVEIDVETLNSLHYEPVKIEERKEVINLNVQQVSFVDEYARKQDVSFQAALNILITQGFQVIQETQQFRKLHPEF